MPERARTKRRGSARVHSGPHGVPSVPDVGGRPALAVVEEVPDTLQVAAVPGLLDAEVAVQELATPGGQLARVLCPTSFSVPAFTAGQCEGSQA